MHFRPLSKIQLKTVITATLLLFSISAQSSTLTNFLREPDVQQKLNLITKASETFNQVTLKHLGENSYPTRTEIAKSAQNYLFISVPYWFSDHEGNLFRDFMTEQNKLKPNLDFRVLFDWTTPGSTGDFFGRKMVKQLKEATDGNIMMWNELWSLRSHSFDILRNRLHDKIMVADGKTLLIGGMNFADEYLQGGVTRKGWHDTDILIEGPAAQEATKLFIKVWELEKLLRSSAHFPPDRKTRTLFLQQYFYEDKEYFSWKAIKSGYIKSGEHPLQTLRAHLPFSKYLSDEKYFPKIENCPNCKASVRLIYDNPLVDRTLSTDPYYSKKKKPLKVYSKTMELIDFLLPHTKKNLRIFIPYLTPYEHFIDSLVKASQRGVKVEIITNSILSHDLGRFPYYAGVGHYRKLLNAGVKIFEWQGHKPLEEQEQIQDCKVFDGDWPGHTIHSKVMIFDEEVSLIGSHNFNQRSEAMNTEIMAFVIDKKLSQELTDVFQYDLDLDLNIQLKCGSQILNRGRFVEEINLEILDTKLQKYEKKSRFWKKLQNYM